MNAKKKVLVIGLDGATWDLLKPWADEGVLPTIQRLMKEGTWGDLESTIPPVTGPAWVSFATGMNPGKTGVFDFLSQRREDHLLLSVNSGDFKGRAFWDILSNDGKNIGIVNFPMLFPPYPINGFMISGIGSSVDEIYTYPKTLKNNLDGIVDDYEIIVNYHDEKYNDDDLFIKDVNRVLDKRARAIYTLIKENDWDLFISVFSCTDWIQHLMWKHIDKSHILHDADISGKYAREFLEIWKKIDGILAEILVLAGDDTSLFIVSDHGFGKQDQCFNLYPWLKQKGYLAGEDEIKSTAKVTSHIISSLSKSSLTKLIPGTIRRNISKKVSVKPFDYINKEKSKVFILRHTIPFGGIYINKNVNGIPISESECDKLKKDLIIDLKNIGKDLNKEISVTVFESDKIYTGKKTHLAPDIIFTINNWRCIINESISNDDVFIEKPYSSRHTGSHRMNGIFLAHGPDIKKGLALSGAKICDIAPTILYMFGISIPEPMDGKVLSDIFDEVKFVKKRIIYQNGYEKQGIKDKISSLKRLRGL